MRFAAPKLTQLDLNESDLSFTVSFQETHSEKCAETRSTQL
jgi:hypothetical protein